MNSQSFYWYDLETFGINPSCDRVAQFAGIRTDQELNIISEPDMFYCQTSNDFLPNPEACLITGILPDICQQKGLEEYRFFQKIEAIFSEPNSCTLGYNSIRFDDEFIRYGFFRNFISPYNREWQNNCSRWDLLDVVRMMAALRPEGIHWPLVENEQGKQRISFRLEHLSQQNDIIHQQAHDALSDVEATIGMAKLIKNAQPKLFDYAFKLRNKNFAEKTINLNDAKILVHVSGKISSEFGHCALVYPIMRHPINKNAIIVFDCRYNPDVLEKLSVEEILQRLYTKHTILKEQALEHIPLKLIHLNKSPMIAPLSTLTPEQADKHQINLDEHCKNAEKISRQAELIDKLSRVYQENPWQDNTFEAEQRLYDGFIDKQDQEMMFQLHQAPESFFSNNYSFFDQRLNQILPRFKAKNFNSLLTPQEQEIWQNYRFERIANTLSLNDYQQEIKHLSLKYTTPQSKELLKKLANYPQQIGLPPIQ